MTGPVVPVAAIEALAAEWERTEAYACVNASECTRCVSFQRVVIRLRALVAEHQAEEEPAPVRPDSVLAVLQSLDGTVEAHNAAWSRLTDEALEDRLTTAIALAFEGWGQAWWTDDSGDVLARVAARAVEAIVAAHTEVDRLRYDVATEARAWGQVQARVEKAESDLAALRERVAETVERVQGEHRPTGRINSSDGWVLCECDAKLPVTGGYTRDGLEVEEWAERRAFEAHVAQQVAAALGGEGR